ncbi:MAG: hypothetical protein CMD16_02745 [Flavobacteriales bacterium]|nr:hypothetical protein [Flavobacteriales bacterium]
MLYSYLSIHILNILDMNSKTIFSWLFILSSCALLAIGRVYEERLFIYNVNLAILISIIYLVLVCFLLFSINRIVLSRTKFLFYLFYIVLFLTTCILWVVFDLTDFGFENFFNFWAILVPISVVIIEKYRMKDVLNTFYVLLVVCCFLAFLSVIGLSVSERADGRTATLGGGPIVFARWMGFGILTLFLLPSRLKKWYKYPLIITFFILAISSGSRGPILSLLMTGIVYLLINFNRIFVKGMFLIGLLSIIVLFFNIDKKISKIGNSDRVFMNISKTGGSTQSTSTRKNLVIGSFSILKKYPLGVGPGNWQIMANKIQPHHLMPLEYPHNLFLEIACEYGLHSLFLFLILLLYVIPLSYNRMQKYLKDKTSLYPLLFYLMVFLFLNSMVSGMLNDSRLLFIVISFILINKPLIASQHVNNL